MAVNHETRNRVLQKLFNLACEEKVVLYVNPDKNELMDIFRSREASDVEVKSVEQLITHYEKWQSAPLNVKGNLTQKFINNCLQDDNDIVTWFARHSISLVNVNYNDTLNIIIQNNLNKPDAVLQYIVQSPKEQNLMNIASLDVTVELMMTKLPQPAGKEALIAYLLAHQYEIRPTDPAIRREMYQQGVLRGLKAHAASEMKDFTVLDFVEKYHKNQTLSIVDETVLPPLRLNLNYENLHDYMGVEKLTLSDTKLWLTSVVLYNLRFASDMGNDFLAIDSVDHHDKQNNDVTVYINVKENSVLTQKNLEKAVNILMNQIKNANLPDREALDNMTKEFHRKYWKMEKLSQSLEQANYPHNNANSENETNEVLATTRGIKI